MIRFTVSNTSSSNKHTTIIPHYQTFNNKSSYNHYKVNEMEANVKVCNYF